MEKVKGWQKVLVGQIISGKVLKVVGKSRIEG
jgi:hypothetical protein